MRSPASWIRAEITRRLPVSRAKYNRSITGASLLSVSWGGSQAAPASA
ncbi:hypothetical protein ACFSQ7_16580 [Paenibacillus rhizoplanae]